eukprot:Skav201241  [mRNA]  locus=scaffold3106:32474:33930:- [translate_table: standard]
MNPCGPVGQGAEVKADVSRGSLARDRHRAADRRLDQRARRGAAHGAAVGGTAGRLRSGDEPGRLRSGDEPGDQDAWGGA